MAVRVEVHKEAEETGDPYDSNRTLVFEQENVIGRVLALVVKGDDGSISLERDLSVNADNFDDNQLAEATVKTLEAKLNESFPNPNKQEEPKIWVPK